MEIGDLVRIIQGGKLVSPWVGETGLVVGKHVRVNGYMKNSWFTVIVCDSTLVINFDYLEKIDEDR